MKVSPFGHNFLVFLWRELHTFEIWIPFFLISTVTFQNMEMTQHLAGGSQTPQIYVMPGIYHI